MKTKPQNIFQQTFLLGGSIITKYNKNRKTLPVISVCPIESFGRNEKILSKVGDTLISVEPVFVFMSLFGKKHIRVRTYSVSTGKCLNTKIVSDD